MTALILLRDWQEVQIEFWRKTNYDGYDVSSFGRVRSWWAKVANKGHSKGFRSERMTRPVIIRGNYDACDYNYLNLGKPYPKVHRLIAQAFLPNPKNLPEVNHVSGYKRDNRLPNLEWSSRPDNMHHASQIGLRDDILPKGERHYRAKLTAGAIRTIRYWHEEYGETYASLARKFWMDASTVNDIVNRRSWKHVK